jgi:hypothetical protein
MSFKSEMLLTAQAEPRGRVPLSMSNSFRVVAIIAAFNEGDIISRVIGHLVENGIDVYLLDNHSTDGTVDQAKPWLGRGLLHIEMFPEEGPPGMFDWTAILSRKEKLAAELKADWFIHHDADEIREGPWPGLSLKDAIRWVDTLGFNCIDFCAFNFPPIDDGYRQGDDPRSYFTLCERVADFDIVQVKCWKAGTPVSLLPSGGHDVEFSGRRIFPIRFLLRHYPIRSQAHGMKKVFSERKARLIEREHAQGWHLQYDQIADEKHCFLRKPDGLNSFDLDLIRLELMMPEKATRDLAERLERTDAALMQARLQQRSAEIGLQEYRQHTSNLERNRQQREQRISDLQAQVIDLERGLDEYHQHATRLEGVRQEHDQQVLDLQRECADLRAQITNLERELKESREQTQNMGRLCEELERERGLLETRAVGVEARLHQLELLMQDLEERERKLKEDIVTIRNSRSWRWTAPFRHSVGKTDT